MSYYPAGYANAVVDLTAAPILTNGSVAGMSAEVNIQSLTADLSFANSTGSLINLDLDLEIVLNDSSQDINTRIEGNGNANLAQFDAGLDSIGLGAAAVADVRLNVDFPTLTVTADTSGSYVDIDPALTEAGSGTHAIMAGVNVRALTLTGAAAASTVAVTLRIAGAPTGGDSNLALWVDDGNARFDGLIISASGSAAGPGLTFQSGTTTGFSAATADVLIASTSGTARMTIDATGDFTFTQGQSTSGSPTGFIFTGGAHITLAASTEATAVLFDIDATVEFATGALTTQRAVRVQAPTYAFAGGSTLTTAITVGIDSAPLAGTNATITNYRGLAVGVEDAALGAAAAGLTYSAIDVPEHDVIVTGGTQITSRGVAGISIHTITLLDTTAVTVDNAASLYIAAAPAAGGSVTLTNAYAIWVDAGNCRFDGSVLIGGVTAPETGSTNTLSILNGTAPDNGIADAVIFYSSDNALGSTIPSFYCEGTDVLATGQADSASSVRVRMRINGTVVVLLAI